MSKFVWGWKETKKTKKKEDNIFKAVRYLFELKQESETIKYVITKDIKNVLKQEEREDYHKAVIVGGFHGNNYVEYESNDDRKKTFSIKEFLDKIKLYLKDIIWKSQWTTAVNMFLSKDTDKQHSKSDNIEIMI